MRKGSDFALLLSRPRPSTEDAVSCTVVVSASTCGMKGGEMQREEGSAAVKTGHIAGPQSFTSGCTKGQGWPLGDTRMQN